MSIFFQRVNALVDREMPPPPIITIESLSLTTFFPRLWLRQNRHKKDIVAIGMEGKRAGPALTLTKMD
jgi:hypothetical protein